MMRTECRIEDGEEETCSRTKSPETYGLDPGSEDNAWMILYYTSLVRIVRCTMNPNRRQLSEPYANSMSSCRCRKVPVDKPAHKVSNVVEDGDGVYAHAEEESVLRSMLSLLHSTLTSLQPSANATGVRAWFRYVYDGPWISESRPSRHGSIT
jgi:hypothetical protein